MNDRLLKKALVMISTIGLLFASVACSSTTTTPAAQEGAGTLGKDFAEILERAKQEGTVQWWGYPPYEHQMVELEKAFNKRFNSNIKIEQLSIHNNEMGSRLAAEKNSGKHSADTVYGSENSFAPWVKEEFLQKVDWAALFGKDLPGVNEAAVNILTEFKGIGLEYRHLVYGIAYNTKLISRDELPKKWEEVADPKWKGQVAVDPSLVALVRLGKVIGEEKVLDMAKKIIANKPIFGVNSPGTMKKVVTGEAKLGLITVGGILDEQQAGAPINFIYPEPLASIASQVIGIPIGAPNPNAGALFSAWLTSNEGMEIQAKWGVDRATVTAPGMDGDYLRKHNLANPPRLTTLEELKAEEQLRKKLIELAKTKK